MALLFDNTYTLADLTRQLGFTTGFFSKIEKFFGVKWGSRSKGEKCKYTPEQYYFFKNVIRLRSYGISLTDIKTFFDKEEKISKHCDKYFPEHDDDACLRLKPYLYPVPGGYIICNTCGYESAIAAGKPEAKKLKELMRERDEYLRIVSKKMEEFNKNKAKDPEETKKEIWER
jgi:DNA-binding transcriptional MerR regulator